MYPEKKAYIPNARNQGFGMYPEKKAYIPNARNHGFGMYPEKRHTYQMPKIKVLVCIRKKRHTYQMPEIKVLVCIWQKQWKRCPKTPLPATHNKLRKGVLLFRDLNFDLKLCGLSVYGIGQGDRSLVRNCSCHSPHTVCLKRCFKPCQYRLVLKL